MPPTTPAGPKLRVYFAATSIDETRTWTPLAFGGSSPGQELPDIPVASTSRSPRYLPPWKGAGDGDIRHGVSVRERAQGAGAPAASRQGDGPRHTYDL